MPPHNLRYGWLKKPAPYCWYWRSSFSMRLSSMRVLRTSLPLNALDWASIMEWKPSQPLMNALRRLLRFSQPLQVIAEDLGQYC